VRDDLKKIFLHHGKENQIIKLIEECSELIKEASLVYNKVDMSDNFIEELADVLVMCEQFKIYIGIEKVESIMSYKIKRTIERSKINV
jgi:NTP pyrophosphatase (non-canonical NTP hydrolase)